jgi:dienelactone hydrolase
VRGTRRGIALFLGAFVAPAAGASPPELKTASTHPMKYHLSLPPDWREGRTWPVVVVIPDAGRDFEGTATAFAKARGSAPFLVVAPHVVTSGGPAYRGAPSYRYSEADWKEVERQGDFRFDADGIAAALSDVRRLYGGEEKYFLTGWEAGGHTVWAMIFRHPEALRAAAPVSANWRGRWVGEADFSKAAERSALPVNVLFCAPRPAPPGWDAFLSQSKEAISLAESHGFRNVSLTMTANPVHGPLADEVLAFFSSVLKTR